MRRWGPNMMSGVMFDVMFEEMSDGVFGAMFLVLFDAPCLDSDRVCDVCDSYASSPHLLAALQTSSESRFLGPSHLKVERVPSSQQDSV